MRGCRIGNGNWTEEDRFRHRRLVRGTPSVDSDEYRHNPKNSAWALLCVMALVCHWWRERQRARLQSRRLRLRRGLSVFLAASLLFPCISVSDDYAQARLQNFNSIPSSRPYSKWKQHEHVLGGPIGGDRAHSARLLRLFWFWFSALSWPSCLRSLLSNARFTGTLRPLPSPSSSSF